MKQAKGTFDVNVIPQKTDNPEAEAAKVGRISLDKKFAGDIEGTSKGEMLFVGTDVEGSGGYVAIERITGTLDGRSGSFILQHSATMQGGEGKMDINVLPDSGTGELKGITGKFLIIIEGKAHSYIFDYDLPAGNEE